MPTPSDTYVRHATVRKVVDADTVDLLVDLGCDVAHKMRCRLNGVNAPEKNTPEGKAAIVWMKEQLPIGNAVVVQTIKDKKEKYGRYLADVYLPGQEVSLNETLMSNGFAKEYHGEART